MNRYILRKLHSSGKSYGGFQWPLEVEAIVECPDWNPNPVCGGGLHGLYNAEGDWGLLDGEVWVVLEPLGEVVHIDKDKCKVPKCRIVYLSESPRGLKNYFDVRESRSAYYWAKDIGDRELMRDRVIEPEWCYDWAKDIGDQELMRDRVPESKWRYYWQLELESKAQEIMYARMVAADSYEEISYE